MSRPVVAGHVGVPRARPRLRPVTPPLPHPDPVISNPLNGQTYNPYSYVRNDPVNRIDPSGYCDSSPCGEGGYVTAATGELEGIAEAAPTGFEWGCEKACQFVISGLALAENVPNIPDMFNSALESAARVKHGATAGDRAEAALTTAGYTASFVFTTSAVVAPLLELPVSGAASMNGTMENGATIRYSSTATAIGDDANTLQSFARSRGAAGHDLIVHGRMLEGEGVFWVNNMPTHPLQVADALLGNPAYRAGTPVQLVTCYGACGPAEELAAILGAPVKALRAPVELHSGTGLLKSSP